MNFRRDTTFDQWLRLYGKVARLVFRSKEVFCREGRSSDFSWRDWLIQVWLLTEPLFTLEVMCLRQITWSSGLYARSCREMLIACVHENPDWRLVPQGLPCWANSLPLSLERPGCSCIFTVWILKVTVCCRSRGFLLWVCFRWLSVCSANTGNFSTSHATVYVIVPLLESLRRPWSIFLGAPRITAGPLRCC